MNDLIQKITEQWFLSEPVLFAILCTHEMVENKAMPCMMRSGHGKIEYNPTLLESLSEYQITMYLKSEVIRILLKHPYERKPSGCSGASSTMASDCVIKSHYNVEQLPLTTPESLNLPSGECYEWYAMKIQEMYGQLASNNAVSASAISSMGSGFGEEAESDESCYGEVGSQDADSVDNNTTHNADVLSIESSKSELWEEDEMRQVEINDVIENASSWGSIPGKMIEMVVANTKARIDYRKVLSGFCASIISSRRNLTRMRPNRRTEFANMGSVYRFRTRLLVAVDVSGSVSTKTLSHFYSVIKRFFRYGVETIDVVQFDTNIGEIEELKKASPEIKVKGRGGTNFQPVIDIVAEKGTYDGLIIFTDGFAPHPNIPKHFNTRVLWICDTEKNYECHKEWMKQTGRVCMMIV